MENRKKIGKIVLCSAAAVLVVAIAVVWCKFGNMLLTLTSIEQVEDGRLFTMGYKGDYGLDKMMETGVSTDQELVEFIVNELTGGIPLKFDLPDLGCSTFVAENKEGQTLFGRNFDMYHSPAMVVKTAPKNGYRSVSVANLAYIGYGKEKLPTKLSNSILALAAPYVPMDGVNEKGLAVSVMLIETEPTWQETEKPDITTTAAIRMLLDKAATTQEAVDLLQQYDMHASAGRSYHFLIADATGSSVVVEYIGNEISILPGEKISTNFLLTSGDFDFGKGQDRYDIIVEELKQCNGVLTAEEAMAVLEKCSQKEKQGKDSSTQWSCVYNLETKTVDIVTGMNWGSVHSFAVDKAK